ncbi:MAG: glycosyltransferase family 39 protein [Candidatus Cloacimonetes bacterium]|nr:glycosyltransferase family 39 protein [Candidatus Cloacimonadota bacterium]
MIIKDIPTRSVILVILGLCAFHLFFLLRFFAPAISTPDAQGYFTQGKIIATHGQTFFIPENNLQYIGPHWHSHDGQKYYTTFPPGFPFLIAIAYKLFGANSTFLINLILASISLLIFFFLCKNWLSNNWSLAATFFLAINPFYNEHALFGDSHTSLIFFFLIALLFLIKAIKTDNYVYAIISGVAIGIVPTIRYAEFVLCIVFGAYIFWLFYTKKISLRTCISFVIGILIPLIPLAMRNHIAFGKFWITSYSLANTQALFGINYLIEHFIPFLVMLATAGMGVLLLFSIGGFIKLLKNSDTKSIAVYFLSSVVILTFTYMAYSWSPDPQSMRFLLPTFPVYTLVSVYFISHLKRKYQIAFLSIALLASLPWGVLGSLRAVKPLYVRNSVLADITKAVERNTEAGSIIITYEGICQNLDLYDKWKLIDISILSKADALTGKRPMKPMRNEYASKVYNSLHGNEFKNQLIEDLNQWSGKKIFMIAYENEIEMVNKLIGDRFNIDKKSSIEISNLPALEFILNRRARRIPHRPRIKPPAGPNRHGSVGPNQIFDFEIRKEPLIIVELTVK